MPGTAETQRFQNCHPILRHDQTGPMTLHQRLRNPGGSDDRADAGGSKRSAHPDGKRNRRPGPRPGINGKHLGKKSHKAGNATNPKRRQTERGEAERRRTTGPPKKTHCAYEETRGDAAMRRCGRRCGGDAATMRRSESGERTKRGEARRSAAKRGEARRLRHRESLRPRRSAAKRGEARPSAAKRGQARPSAAKRGQNTASGAAAHTGHNTHTVGERGQLRHTVGAAAAPKQQPVSCWNRGAATLFVPKMGANGKKISIKMQRRLHFLEPKVKRKKTRLFEKFRT